MQATLKHISSRILPRDKAARNRWKVIIENSCSNTITNLVGGNFLTGLLLYFDATTVEIGMINIIIYVCNALQLLSPLLLERFRKRKRFLIGMYCFTQFFNIVMIGVMTLLPVTNRSRVLLILICLAISNISSALSTQGFSLWHMQSIPEDKRASFFSTRLIVINAAIYVFVLAGSYIVDQCRLWTSELDGMLLIRVIAVLITVIDIITLIQIPEYPYEENSEKTNLKLILTAPFKQKTYLVSVSIIFLWNFISVSSGSYFTVYLLDALSVSYSYINFIGALFVPIVIIVGPIWAKVIHKTGWLFTLGLSLLLDSIAFVAQGFTTADNLWFYPASVILAHIVSPGLSIVTANMFYYNIPRENQSVYLTFCTTCGMVGGLMGSYFATLFATLGEGASFTLSGITFTTPQIMVAFTGFMMFLFSLYAFGLHQWEKRQQNR